MIFPNRRTALAFLALLLPPLLMTLLAFVTLATAERGAMAVGAPLDAAPTATAKIPASAQALELLQQGIAQQEAGQYAAAAAAYQAALTIDPTLAPVHAALGSLYVAAGQPQQAIAHYQTAARLEPERAEWQHALGVALANQGETGQGLAALEQAVRLGSDDPRLYYELGQVYAYLGRAGDARQALTRALALSPDEALAAAVADQLRQLADAP